MPVVRLVAVLAVAGVVAVSPICVHAGQSIAAPDAASRPLLAPGVRYDPAIPTLQQVTGHDVGDAITSPEEIVRYLQALARAAPDRTVLFEYARTWEDRPLFMLAIGAPARMSRLDEIKSGLRRIADPRGLSPGEIDRLVGELPVVVALIHGVHGNEISSSGAAVSEAYHLLAARGDTVVDAILRDAIVLVDPSQNPDGRARFLAQNALGSAAAPDAEPLAAEHDEPWPGGRSNHYLFDLNRDWFAQAHPETRGRVRTMLEWMPHVVVDLHEMGGDSTYYFPPAAQPSNPWMTPAQHKLMEEFGRANARRFDERGFAYFNREVYDSFYPGYGVSWPIAHGAIGMTFEQASARGLVWQRRDGADLTYYDGILHHFTAAITTADTAARNRERILRDFVAFRQGIRDADQPGGVRSYLLPAGSDPARTARLARLLAANGIEVRRADEAVTVGTRKLSAGTFIVPLGQPAGRLARNLLDAQTSMAAEFVTRQDERRRLRLPDEIYDVTAWSLPLLWDVEIVPVTTALTVESSPVAAADGAGATTSAPLAPAKVGYLLPWNAATAEVVIDALAAGLTVRFTPAAFTLNGRRFQSGTAIVRVSDNGPDLARRLAAIVGGRDAAVVPTDSAFVEQGASLGSGQVRALRTPRVLLAWDAPTVSLSAGWARYVIERRFGQAVTAVRVATLPRTELSKYDVMVLPQGSYSPAIGAELLRRLKEWISNGGTLITLGEASRWAARSSVALLSTASELRDGRAETETPPKPSTEAPARPFDYESAITPAQERPELVPGAILRVSLDVDHWLAAGADGEIQVMVESQRVFTPITLDKGRNVGVYQARDTLVASGLVWDQVQQGLERKAYLIEQPMGQGRIIAFAEDPNARAYAEASSLLFINAILLGAAR